MAESCSSDVSVDSDPPSDSDNSCFLDSSSESESEVDLTTDSDDPSSCSSILDSSSDSESESPLRMSKRKCIRQPYRTSINNHFKVYALTPSLVQFDYSQVLADLKADAVDLMQQIELPSYKFSLAANCTFKREIEDTDEDSINCWFRSNSTVKINDEMVTTLIDNAVLEIEAQIQNFVQLGSGKRLLKLSIFFLYNQPFNYSCSQYLFIFIPGWIFQNCTSSTAEISLYTPLSGGNHKATCKLPKKLFKKQSLLNIDCNDNKCFLYSVIAQFYPADPKDKSINSSRSKYYKTHADKFDMTNIEYPVKLSDISKVRLCTLN